MQECVFCKIIENKISSKIIDQNEDILVIQDIAPKAPIHYLIIPKKHVKDIASLDQSDMYLIAKMAQMAKLLSHSLHGSKAFRLIVNNGADVGQTVWHLHCHFISGNRLSDF